MSPTQQGMKIRLWQEINLWFRSREIEGVSGRVINTADEERRSRHENDQMSRSLRRRFLCDGSFKGEIQKAGIGVVVVNPEGRVMDGYASCLLCRGPIVAEAYAVLTACKIAARERVEAEVWSDCRQVVRVCIDTEADSPWECSAVVAEIRDIMRSAPWISLWNCRREHVAAADGIAKKVRDHLLEPDWLQHLLGCEV